MAIAEPLTNVLPTHLDLPDSDGLPVENMYQPIQSMLLTGSLTPHLDRLNPDGNYFIGSDNGIYWRIAQEPLSGCKAPDWFYVRGVPRLLNGILRRSYVMWQELKSPTLIIEYVSGNGSEERDATPESGKFWVYENAIRAQFYAIRDPDREELAVYELVRDRYRTMSPNADGRFRLASMELDLGVWHGEYLGITRTWVRAWDAMGRLIPTPEERAESERDLAAKERGRADRESERAEKLAERLRQLGIDPDTV